jgi:hypothetical protein
VSAGQRAQAGPRAGRRKGWRIAARLRVIIAAPLVAVFGFAGLALADTAGQAEQAGRLGGLVRLATDAGDLAYNLELERAAAVDLLTTNKQPQLDSFNQQTARSDASAAGYRAQRAASAGAVPTVTRALLDRVDGQLGRLGPLREQVRFGQQASVSSTAFGYRILIADLLAYRESVAQSAASLGVADDMRAAAALAQAIESAGQQEVAVVRAVAAGQLTPAMQGDIIATRAGFTEASLAFLSLAPASWRTWWEQASTGQVPLTAQVLQEQVARVVPGQPVALDTTGWIGALAGWTYRLFQLEQRVDTIVGDEVERARRGQTGRAGIEAGATALALLLTFLVTTVVARRISRRLGRLRDTANEVAFNQLPAVVEELRVADPVTVRPDQVAEQVAPEPERVSGDEIGEVALAFAHVHRSAVYTAAEQAVMRAATAEIFVHLSRREQRLVDAVLAQVDDVERDETDPDRLEKLYRLDNLATRMARINSSLLVLGGVGSGRVRHEDVPLVKVLQAALSQVEHYRRVRIGMIDDGVGLAAEAVDEVVHLLAELLDNATSYSPPDSESWMTARALHDRVVVQIGDEGVGLPSQRRDELNALLHRPPAVDVAAIRNMGLTVVGHLAMRYGIRVELRPGPKLGTIAEVEIPLTLTRPTPKTAPLAVAPADAGPAGNGNGAEPHGNGARRNGHHAVIDLAQPAPPPAADLDTTAQLPIFHQVSGWFRAEVGESGGWPTVADEAWRQAQRAAQVTPGSQTSSGLPKRTPREHLVPGAVEVPPDREARVDQRDPDRVAAAMAAYARGVAARRPAMAANHPRSTQGSTP